MSKEIIALSRVETRGAWELWCFIILPRTKRYIWIKDGSFPISLFNTDSVLEELGKSYDDAINTKDKEEGG